MLSSAPSVLPKTLHTHQKCQQNCTEQDGPCNMTNARVCQRCAKCCKLTWNVMISRTLIFSQKKTIYLFDVQHIPKLCCQATPWRPSLRCWARLSCHMEECILEISSMHVRLPSFTNFYTKGPKRSQTPHPTHPTYPTHTTFSPKPNVEICGWQDSANNFSSSDMMKHHELLLSLKL